MTKLVPGDTAPNISGPDVTNNGTQYDLSAIANKVIVLAFTRYECPNCEDELTKMQHLWTEFGQHDVQFVANIGWSCIWDSTTDDCKKDPVTGNYVRTTIADEKTWLGSLLPGGITFPVIHDPNNSNQDKYNTAFNMYPLMYIIYRNRIIAYFNNLPLETEDAIRGHIMDALSTRQPINLEMIMDVSDSMNSAPSGGSTKLDMMKQAVTIILDFLKDHAQTNDRAGLVWFTDNVSEYSSNGQKLIPLVLSNIVDLQTKVNAKTTGTCTAMGAGLQRAFDVLKVSGSQYRYAILLTDGIQNIEPQVQWVNNDHLEIIDGNGWCGPHSTEQGRPGKDVKSYNTRVHTIGIGVTANYGDLLTKIANETGGFYLGTYNPAADLLGMYFVDLCNSMAGGSPSIVHYHAGTYTPETCKATEVFSINRSVRKITAILAWEKNLNGSLAFWLRAPDGTLLDISSEMKISNTYAMARVYLPKHQNGIVIPSVGSWQMVVHGETCGPASYRALIIAEDPEIHIAAKSPAKIYEVGDIVPLHINITDAKNIIGKQVEIRLDHAAHRVPVQQILSEYRLPMTLPEIRPRIRKYEPDPVAQKLKALSHDPRMQKYLVPEEMTFSLRQGTLSCQISEEGFIVPVQLSSPGLHTIRVEVHIDSQDQGPISRMTMVSVHAGAGPADRERTPVSIIPIQTEKTRASTLLITPRNAAGQLFGPGYAGEFEIVLGQRIQNYSVTDLLDGSYCVEIPLDRKVSKKGFSASVSFKRTKIWEGSIKP